MIFEWYGDNILRHNYFSLLFNIQINYFINVNNNENNYTESKTVRSDELK
jgi:hypothetical protein